MSRDSFPNEFSFAALPAAFREHAPEVALVLGSGLGGFVDQVDVRGEVPYGEISGLPESKVAGHEGRFVFADLAGLSLVIAQGRVHLYEGHPACDITAGIRCMAAAGAKRLILTNAAGSANKAYAPGRWMALSDHLNLTGTTPLLGGAHFYDMSEVYSRAMRGHFQSTANDLGIELHEGVYAGLLGPQYETPAEVRMVQTLGGDAVGMSTVLEAIQARALGMEVGGFSCLTNWGAGLGQESLNHEEVMETGQVAADQLVQILSKGLPGLV